MAFVQGSNTRITRYGSGKLAFGSFTNGGSDTGGTINTGLSMIETVWFTPTGSTSAATMPRCTTALPVASGSFVVVTDADVDGQWHALGR